MNSHFSFHRIKLLSLRYVTEHWRRELVTLSAFLIAFAFIPRFISDLNDQIPVVLFIIILFLGGVRFTAHIFHEIHHTSGGMHYVHIPASRLEKFTFNGILTLLLFPSICLLLYYCGNLIGNLLAPIIPSFINYRIIEFSFSTLLPNHTLGKWVLQLLSYHAIFFLGSLYFKKHPTTKTFLWMILLGCALSIVELFLIKIIWGGVDSLSTLGGDSSSVTIAVNGELLSTWIKNTKLATFISYLAISLSLLFIWIVAYLKFNEKQV